MNSKSALVTGGAGFIGSHLVEELVRRGFAVHVVDDLSTGADSNLAAAKEAGDVTVTRGDIREIGRLEGLPEKPDVVFHEAAIASVPKSIEDPSLVHDVNVNASLAVMNFCVKKGIKRFVFASSAAVYGNIADPPAREEFLCAPESPYGASKLSVENYMHAYYSAYGLETVALRYFNVYGPRQRAEDGYSGVIPLFARKLLSSATPTVFGDGEQTRDFVYVADVVRANILALDSQKAGGMVFNVASGTNVSVLGLLRKLEGVTGLGPVKPTFASARVGDPRSGSASIERARKILGYEPKVGLDEGLAAVVKDISARLGVVTV